MNIIIVPGLSDIQGAGVWYWTKIFYNLLNNKHNSVRIYNEPKILKSEKFKPIIRRFIYLIWLNLIFPLETFKTPCAKYIFANFMPSILPVNGKKITIIHDLYAPSENISF